MIDDEDDSWIDDYTRDDWDDHWTEPEPPDHYYDREEPNPVHGYDEQFTKTERARVEALRLLGGPAVAPELLLRDAPALEAYILGPEATAPDPYAQLREAVKLAGELMVKAGAEVDPWKGVADDAETVTVTKGDVRALWHLLESITNPF